MNRFNKLSTALLCCLPLFAAAQTSSTPRVRSLPAEQPRSNLEKQQTQQIGEATQYGQPGSSASSQTSRGDAPRKRVKKTKKTKDASSADPAPAR